MPAPQRAIQDDEVELTLYYAVEGFAPELRRAALNWMNRRQADFQFVRELESKGLTALLSKYEGQ